MTRTVKKAKVKVWTVAIYSGEEKVVLSREVATKLHVLVEEFFKKEGITLFKE